MKLLLFILLSALTCQVNAQKLKKPKKDKKTGVTTTSTEDVRLTPHTTKILWGKEYRSCSFQLNKTDTGSFYISIGGETDGYRFQMKRGDTVKLSLSNGSMLMLLAERDVKIRPHRGADDRIVSYWYNDCLLDENSVRLLKENEVVKVGTSPSGINLHFSYTVDEKKKDAIKKAIALFAD